MNLIDDWGRHGSCSPSEEKEGDSLQRKTLRFQDAVHLLLLVLMSLLKLAAIACVTGHAAPDTLLRNDFL